MLMFILQTQGAMTVRELIAYRREAEQYLGPDDHLYRVHWVRTVFVVLSFFLGKVVFY